MTEHLSNDFSTTLNGSINNSTTTVNVNSSTGAPAANFRVRVDDELMLVTSTGTGLNWTVTRGIESTTAATHSDLAPLAHVITKGGLDQYLSENYVPLPLSLPTAWTVVKKTADESVTSSTTLQDDDTLQLAVSANTKYAMRMTVYGSFGAGAVKWRITGPTSPTYVTIVSHFWSNADIQYSAFQSSDVTDGGTNTFYTHHIVLHNGANAGTVKFTWAQNVSNGAASTIKAGSTLEWMSF